jgi:methionyl-tRNA formyltransferase
MRRNARSINIGIFADKYVGAKTVEFILQNYFTHLKVLVVTDEKSNVLDIIGKYSFPKDNVFLSSELNSESVLKRISDKDLDYIILAWWPYIVEKKILTIPKVGTLNFHPSLLPYNRGKHYNFWTIVEDTPFGVTIHFADESIDGGDIIFQKKITKSWEDTGESLYEKAQSAMIELFTQNYDRIVNGNYHRVKQDKNIGSFHYGRELEQASEIFLKKKYSAKQLLNLLRARTFPPHPACYFFDGGRKYEVRIEIKEVK